MACKICDKPVIRDQVDRMIYEKVHDTEIIRVLKHLNEACSPTTLRTHRLAHPPLNDVSNVELCEVAAAALPAKPVPMASDVDDVIAQMTASVESGDLADLLKDRLVRELMICRLYDAHLAATTVALDRFKNGSSAYPNDAVRGLSAIASMYDKTRLSTLGLKETADHVFEQHLAKLAETVREAGKSAKGGKMPSEYLCHDDRYEYLNKSMPANEFNRRMTAAWRGDDI